MSAFAQRLHRAQNRHSVSPKRPDHANSRNAPAWNPYLTEQSAWGNQGLQRLLRTRAIQAKLTVNEPGDKYEQEADRVADQVMRMSEPGDDTDRSKAATASLVQRKVNASGGGVGAAPPIVQDALSSPRQPLDAATQAFFEPRFGHDFAGVRIHADPVTAQLSQAIGARAFTIGQQVFFGAGEYRPSSNSSRRLIAHELAHVVQQNPNQRSPIGDAMMFRSSGATGISSVPFNWTLLVAFTTETSSATSTNVQFDITGKIPTAIVGSVFDGDVIVLEIMDSLTGAIPSGLQWMLPPELQLVQDFGSHKKVLRVVGKLAKDEMDRGIDISITDSSGEQFMLRSAFRALPSGADVTNPEIVQNANELARLRAERDDSPEGKAAFKERKRALKEKRRELEQADSCSPKIQKTINEALARAVEAANAAIVKLTSRDPSVQKAMSESMNWSPSSTSPSPDEKTLTKIIDILTLARNSMLTSSHKTFACVPVCEKESHAAEASGKDRDSTIDLCPIWYQSDPAVRKLSPTNDLNEAKAYALLHEFVHLSGPSDTDDDELYVRSSEWETLDFEVALQMADAYASLAWNLAKS